VDCLLGIASEVHSVVVVIACLGNLYDKVLKVMGRSTLDRLEKDPPPVHLTSNLSYSEIEAIMSYRLAWMFAKKYAAYRATEPVYPLQESWLRNFVNRPPRNLLDQCLKYQNRCVEARKILDRDVHSGVEPSLPDPIAAAWDAEWQAARIAGIRNDDEILSLVSIAAQAFAVETGASVTLPTEQDNPLRLHFSANEDQRDLVVGVTGGPPARGRFPTEVGNLRLAARGAIGIAVRIEEFPRGAKCKEAIDEFTAAGGRLGYLDKSTIRALLAYRELQSKFPAEKIAAWQRAERPISSLQPIVDMFSPPPQSASTPGASARSKGRRSTAARTKPSAQPYAPGRA
jgi:hypothetical protein